MFDKMTETMKAKLDNGNGGYEWNCDAEDFYDALYALYQMALAGVISQKQWKKITDLVIFVIEVVVS